MIDPGRGVSPDGRVVSAPSSTRRGRDAASRACGAFRNPIKSLISEKPHHNDEYGTGSLVARQRPVAFERRRRRLFELVRAHGSGERPERERASLGAHEVPEKLDPGALCRARAELLA